VTEMEMKLDVHIISFLKRTDISRKQPMPAVLSITPNENILDSHVMIVIEISL